jgi:tetratricopeptide (TPR) repeat protein
MREELSFLGPIFCGAVDMMTLGMGRLCQWMVVAALALGLQSPAKADDKDPLREKALALNDVTGDDTIKAEVKALVAKPDEAKKLLAKAVAMSKEKEQPFNFTAAHILAQAAEELKLYDPSKVFYWICAEEANKLQSSQKLAQAYGGLLSVNDALYLDKKYDESGKLAQKILEMMEKQGITQEARAEVLWKLVRAWAKQGKAAEANKMVDNYIKAKDTDWHRYEIKGRLKRELNENDEARRIYEELGARIDKDKAIKADEKEELKEGVQYILSGLYIELNKADSAIEVLRKLVAKHPDNSTFNNDLGYVLADNDRELDNAEKMIRKALEEDRKLRSKIPDLPAELNKDSTPYLDSLGWVLFKKKKYQEAKKELLEATKDKVDGQHVEILDHLGDVHMALGEKAEAIAVWKHALTQEVTSNRDKQRKAAIEKKVKDAK